LDNQVPKPQISVVMPVWNGAKYLNSAIESVLNQTFKDFELIIVDDASTDETAEIIANYLNIDSRINTIRNSNNLKLPASLNAGFRTAKGSWLTWTSDDNVLEPHCLEILINFATERNIDFVFSDYKVIDGDGKIVGISKTGPSEKLLSENTIGACFLYARQIFKTVGDYDENKFMYEDYEYWVRTFKAGFRMAHIENQNPYRYRIHDLQLSNKKKLPKHFVEFRYKLSQEIIDQRDRIRAFLSVIRISINLKAPKFAIKSCARLVAINPFVTLPIILQTIVKKMK
jgi:glycosyltransferase involved in cell wall biosynthesis